MSILFTTSTLIILNITEYNYQDAQVFVILVKAPAQQCHHCLSLWR